MKEIFPLTYPVFKALTRPAMIAGVSIEYLMLMIMVCLSCVIMFDDLRLLGLFVPLYSVGWVVFRTDHHLFAIWLQKQQLHDGYSRRFFGGHYYDAF